MACSGKRTPAGAQFQIYNIFSWGTRTVLKRPQPTQLWWPELAVSWCFYYCNEALSGVKGKLAEFPSFQQCSVFATSRTDFLQTSIQSLDASISALWTALFYRNDKDLIKIFSYGHALQCIPCQHAGSWRCTTHNISYFLVAQQLYISFCFFSSEFT